MLTSSSDLSLGRRCVQGHVCTSPAALLADHPVVGVAVDVGVQRGELRGAVHRDHELLAVEDLPVDADRARSDGRGAVRRAAGPEDPWSGRRWGWRRRGRRCLRARRSASCDRPAPPDGERRTGRRPGLLCRRAGWLSLPGLKIEHCRDQRNEDSEPKAPSDLAMALGRGLVRRRPRRAFGPAAAAGQWPAAARGSARAGRLARRSVPLTAGVAPAGAPAMAGVSLPRRFAQAVEQQRRHDPEQHDAREDQQPV